MSLRLFAGFLLLGAVGCKPSSERHEARVTLPVPRHLSPTARQVIARMMHRHGANMLELQRSILMLDYESVGHWADRMGSTPRIADVQQKDATDLNSDIPRRFFDLQASIRAQAKQIGKAAAGKDHRALGRAYGELTETCVSCHAFYLNQESNADSEGK